jgi:tRNA-dihydrouridine synthase A
MQINQGVSAPALRLQAAALLPIVASGVGRKMLQQKRPNNATCRFPHMSGCAMRDTFGANICCQHWYQMVPSFGRTVLKRREGGKRQETAAQMSENKSSFSKGSLASQAHRLSVAPMMDWTDRHCRVFHRQMTRRAMLYTEMVTAPAIVHGPKARLLDYSDSEHPVALQLGGSDPVELAAATRIASAWGYDEINLNCGCPSDRVQSGCFGAVLMERPGLVADCVRAMMDETDIPVTVKCRIGVDDQDPETILPQFIETIAAAGVRHVIVHARKAWLQGLSPKENREIPPLDHDLVFRMKERFPDLTICINGGITSLEQARGFLDAGLDGVMIGRAAYHDPGKTLIGADALWGESHAPDRLAVVEAMRPYIARHLASGGRLHQITRHMLGLFLGRPGARGWRRVLSERATREGAGLEVVDAALAELQASAAA